MTIVEMSVHMCCPGCESKIRKALLKLEGVHDVEVDMVMQKVTVTGWVEQKKALKAVRKTGRRAVLWPYLMNAEPASYTYNYNYNYNQAAPSPAVALNPVMTFHAVPARRSSSSYNYRKHGYDYSSLYGYYQKPPHSHIIDENARSMFSDDNPHACTIM